MEEYFIKSEENLTIYLLFFLCIEKSPFVLMQLLFATVQDILALVSFVHEMNSPRTQADFTLTIVVTLVSLVSLVSLWRDFQMTTRGYCNEQVQSPTTSRENLDTNLHSQDSLGGVLRFLKGQRRNRTTTTTNRKRRKASIIIREFSINPRNYQNKPVSSHNFRVSKDVCVCHQK